MPSGFNLIGSGRHLSCLHQAVGPLRSASPASSLFLPFAWFGSPWWLRREQDTWFLGLVERCAVLFGTRFLADASWSRYPAALAGKAASLIDRLEERSLTQKDNFYSQVSFYRFSSTWWTGRPGVLRFMGSQRVGHDWATELNWTELRHDTFGFGWSPESHQSKENPFLAAVTFLDSAKGEKTRQKDESQPGSILTTRWLDALQVVAGVGWGES